MRVRSRSRYCPFVAPDEREVVYAAIHLIHSPQISKPYLEDLLRSIDTKRPSLAKDYRRALSFVVQRAQKVVGGMEGAIKVR